MMLLPTSEESRQDAVGPLNKPGEVSEKFRRIALGVQFAVFNAFFQGRVIRR
jgi:hypothetical protein